MASDSEKDELIAQFQAISGQDTERSQFYMESSGWKLDVALSAFYEGAGDDEPMATEAGEATGGAAAAAGAGAPRAPPGSTFNAAADDSSSDEDGQAFYAGGSSTSGQQILGPPKKKKDGADLVSEMFKRARESGAEQVDPGAGTSRGPGGRAFHGQAFKLGSDSTSTSEVVPGAAKPPEPREFTLKMWSNGFSIDDGPLREYNDPTNRHFLESVMKGRIPTELIKEARGGEVHVNMEDHKQEEYVRPKATKKPFQGQGHMLGSVAPEVNTGAPAAAAAAPAAASVDDTKVAEEKAKAHFAPDGTATTVQVRLHDGSRLIARMNTTRTVGDLREYVRMARPSLRDSPFVMRMSFPAKELDDESATLEGAGLLNAAVMIRMK